ncbi:unnamed protein product [Ectocarpus sp. 12 AP-2014]
MVLYCVSFCVSVSGGVAFGLVGIYCVDSFDVSSVSFALIAIINATCSRFARRPVARTRACAARSYSSSSSLLLRDVNVSSVCIEHRRRCIGPSYRRRGLFIYLFFSRCKRRVYSNGAQGMLRTTMNALSPRARRASTGLMYGL